MSIIKYLKTRSNKFQIIIYFSFIIIILGINVSILMIFYFKYQRSCANNLYLEKIYQVYLSKVAALTYIESNTIKLQNDINYMNKFFLPRDYTLKTMHKMQNYADNASSITL